MTLYGIKLLWRKIMKVKTKQFTIDDVQYKLIELLQNQLRDAKKQLFYCNKCLIGQKKLIDQYEEDIKNATTNDRNDTK